VRRLFLLASILVLAGCGGSSGGGNGPQAFSTSDLPKLVLKPSDSPKELEYVKRESGSGVLEKGSTPQALAPLKEDGLQGDYVAKFLSKGGPKGPVFAESLALVFKDSNGASKALAFTRNQATASGGKVAIPAKGLGDEGWGLRGSFFNPRAPLTYFYTWRVGNAVQSFILSGLVNEKQARAYADTLNRRAKALAT
jgi:hypothetical protein